MLEECDTLLRVYSLKTHQLINILIEFIKICKADLMIYGGAQSGIWGKVILKIVPNLKIIGIEANPNVYVHYFPKLSQIFLAYINAALTNQTGLATLNIPTELQNTSSDILTVLDKRIFARYHHDAKKSREGWRTDASLFIDMSGEAKSMLVPTVRVSDLLCKAERVLLFLDIQGADFSVLTELDSKSIAKVCLIYVEFDRVNESFDRRSAYDSFMDQLDGWGFKYYGNDEIENSQAYNMLFVRKEFVDLLDSSNFPDTSFKYTFKDIFAQESISSRLRLARVPGHTAIARIISLVGIDVHRSR